MADQICLRYNEVSFILELRCRLAHCCDICLTHGVRSQPPQRLEPAHAHLFYLETPLHALLRGFVSSMEYSLQIIVLCWSIYCNGDIEAASS